MAGVDRRPGVTGGSGGGHSITATSRGGTAAASSSAGVGAAAADPPVDGKTRARRVDQVARKSFPLAFLLFIIVYWVVYTVPTSDANDTAGVDLR